MKKSLLLSLLAFVTLFGFVSCSEDDSDTELENLGRTLQNVGYIKGTVTGTRTGGQAFTHTFDYRLPGQDNYFWLTDTVGSDRPYANFHRAKDNLSAYGNAANANEDYAYVSLDFSPRDEINIANVQLDDFDMQFSQNIGNELFVYGGDWGPGEAPITWERINYNPTTQRLTGKFTIVYGANASFSWYGNTNPVTFTLEFDVLAISSSGNAGNATYGIKPAGNDEARSEN